MLVEQRMTERRRIKVILIISLLSIFLLYIVNDFLSTKDYGSYNQAKYVSQYLLPQKKRMATVAVPGDTTNSVNITKPGIDKNIHSPNITITIFNTKDAKTTFKISYNAASKRTTRNVFVEMREINKSADNIFFIETRCSTEKMAIHFAGNKGFVLNARQCCAIESTAQMNLDHNIYIFHSCSLHHDFIEHSPKFVEKLFKYPNVHVVRLNTTEVFLDSPLEDLQRKKLLEESIYPVEHASDLIRLALLWKFGGTYSDLDVVTIRSFNDLKINWAGMQDTSTIANGVLNFESGGVGHSMLQKALEHVNAHYDPSQWSSNGPLLITPIILEECKAKQVIDTVKHCKGSFTVFNESVLYPIYYTSAGSFFDNDLGEQIVSQVKNKSYSVHIWNKMSHELEVKVGSTQGYALLADEYCPLVYRNCGPLF